MFNESGILYMIFGKYISRQYVSRRGEIVSRRGEIVSRLGEIAIIVEIYISQNRIQNASLIDQTY